MPAPRAVIKLVESCNSQTISIICPIHTKPVDITVAKWQTQDGHTTPWVVVDCPLLPAGTVSCDMSCLVDLESSPEVSGSS
jgi:hypothetical protein